MTAVMDLPDVDLLGMWAAAKTQRVRLHGRMVEAELRFAFYGHVSTEDYQDPVTSRRWQFDSATELVAGRGRITADYRLRARHSGKVIDIYQQSTADGADVVQWTDSGSANQQWANDQGHRR